MSDDADSKAKEVTWFRDRVSAEVFTKMGKQASKNASDREGCWARLSVKTTLRAPNKVTKIWDKDQGGGSPRKYTSSQDGRNLVWTK